MYYIIPINKKRKEREGEGKEREESFFCVYDSVINIHVFMLGKYVSFSVLIVFERLGNLFLGK